MALSQQSGGIASYAYLISAFISVSLTFLVDRFLKNRQATKDKSSDSSSKNRKLKTSNEKSPKNLQKKTEKVIPLNQGKNHTSKAKKKKRAN
jgi:flagellar biosynthesis component FlhA